MKNGKITMSHIDAYQEQMDKSKKNPSPTEITSETIPVKKSIKKSKSFFVK